MKVNPSKCNQQYPAMRLNQVRFAPTALALGVMAATSALLPVQAVHAQGATMLEEIIVTARKREESLQQTPVAVNVLTADMIDTLRIEGMKDLGTIIPGMVTTETTSSTAGVVALRGVGTGALNPLFDQAVSINIDGVGISSAAMMNAGMFDLDRIEVLRGPQALFFGKNSPGGVIALHTKDPGDEFELKLTAQYETEGEEPILRAVISGPLSETLGARLSMGWSDADNSRFEAHNMDVFETGPTGAPVQTAFDTGPDPQQTEKIFIMGTLLWEPSDNLSATLKYAHLEDNQDGHTGFNFQRTQCSFGVPQVVVAAPGIDNCTMDGNVTNAGISPLLTVADPNYPGFTRGFSDNEDNFASLEINYEISDTLSLTSVTGYYDNHLERAGEASTQVVSGLVNSVGTDLEQWSQEIRLNSNLDGPVNYAMGAFYETREISQNNAVTFGSNLLGIPVAAVGVFPIAVGQQHVDQESTAYSVFGQVNWDISDQLTLAVGARYSYEEKEGVIELNHFALNPDFTALPGGGPRLNVPLVDNNPDWSNFSPEVTLSYQYTDDIMFFASYRTGFKSGGFDAAFATTRLAGLAAAGIPHDSVYNEEEAEGFEAGIKSTLLDNTLRFNATAYWYEYDGLQLSIFVTGADGVPALSVQNAASATVQGLELETLWLTPVEGLSLTANLALNDASYDDYISSCYGGQTIALGCNLNPNAAGQFTGADMAGKSIPYASDVSATLAMDYQVAVSDGWNMGFNVTASFKDDYNPTSSDYPEAWYQQSYWLTNASVSVFSSDDKWEFFVRGINLGEEYYTATGSNVPLTGSAATTGTNDASGLPDFFQFINGGRQVMLGMTYRL